MSCTKHVHWLPDLRPFKIGSHPEASMLGHLILHPCPQMELLLSMSTVMALAPHFHVIILLHPQVHAYTKSMQEMFSLPRSTQLDSHAPHSTIKAVSHRALLLAVLCFTNLGNQLTHKVSITIHCMPQLGEQLHTHCTLLPY